MSMLGRLVSRMRGAETRSQPTSWDLMQAHGDSAGAPVNAHMAENIAAVYAAVQVIAETVAALPVTVYRLDDSGRREVRDHPVARLFEMEPNARQTPFEFVETLVAHALLRGNAYGEIVRDGRGAPTAVHLLHPDRVSVQVVRATGRVVYDITREDGTAARLLPEEMLHLKDRSDDGIVGKSRLTRARETFSTALQTERYALNTYRNGAAMTGVLQHPEELGPEPAQRLRESFERIYAGAGNAGRVAVLEEGTEWKQLSVSPENAQMLQSRRFSVEQIARMFRVPPPMLQDLANATYSNVVEMNRMFATHTVKPWVRRLEQAIEQSLFSEDGRRVHRVQFDMNDLLRGDMQTRFEAYRIGREIGVFNANELREFEGLDPRTDADAERFLSPMNMQSEGRAMETRDLSELTPAQRESLQRRLTIRARYQPRMVEALRPIIERDARAVLDALNTGTVEELLAGDHYNDLAGDEGAVASALLPIALEMERDVRPVIEAETGERVDDAEPFTRAMMGSVGTSYAEASRAQVETLQDRPDDLRARVEEWMETRAEDLGSKVAVRVESGVSHRLYRKARKRRGKIVDPKGKNNPAGRLNEPVVERGEPIGENLEASADLHNPPLAPDDERVLVAAD
jgi:HK97 family phage portal protein